MKDFFVLTYPRGGREIVSRKRKDNKKTGDSGAEKDNERPRFRGVCRTGSARFQKYSRFPGLMRFSRKMFGWTAGFSAPNLEDLHEEVQVFDSKAILGRFAGGLSGIGSFGFLRQALAINWLELGFVFA